VKHSTTPILKQQARQSNKHGPLLQQSNALNTRPHSGHPTPKWPPPPCPPRRRPHQILGTALVGLFLAQPLLGLLRRRRRRPPPRAGPRSPAPTSGAAGLLIAAGILDGGLGLLLARNARPALRAAHAAVTALVAGAYVAAQVW
jgi:hypothetical protein